MTTEQIKKFGEFIEERRKKTGITLRGLASTLEITPSYMSDIEKGRPYPTDKEKLDQIAEKLMLVEEDRNLMSIILSEVNANWSQRIELSIIL